MADINKVSSSDTSSIQQISDQNKVTTTQSRLRPPYDTSTGSPNDGTTLTGKAPSLPSPQGKIDIGQANGALDKISQNVAFDFYEIAALLVQLNNEAEKISRDEVVRDILSVADEMNQSADDLRASAGLTLASGIVSGVGQIVAGGISVAGGAQSFKIASEAAPTGETKLSEESQTKTTSETTEQLTEANLSKTMEEETPTGGKTETAQASAQETVEDLTKQLTTDKAKVELDKVGLSNLKEQNATFIISQKANSISMRTQGYSQITTGISQMAASGLKYGADELQAKSKKDDALTETRRAAMERDRQYADGLHKSAQDMQQTLKDIQQSQHQTTSQIMSSRV